MKQTTIGSVTYTEVPGSQAVRLITNGNKISKELQHTIQYTHDSVYKAIMYYLQKTKQNNSCPFVPTFHNHNLYHVLKYDMGEGNNIHFEKFFNQLEPEYQKIRAALSQEAGYEKLLDYTGLMIVLSDPSLNTPEFSMSMEEALMRQKSKFIANGRMGGAMLSHPKGGATRISHPGREENPEYFSIDHPFQVEGYNMIFYRAFHPGQMQRITHGSEIQFDRNTAIKYGDIGSVRTPQDMLSCLSQHPDQAHKYINLFIAFLNRKPDNDLDYLNTLHPGEKTPHEIVVFFYEQYLMNLPTHCLHGLEALLQTDFHQGVSLLRSILEKTKFTYAGFIDFLQQFLDKKISFDTMITGLTGTIKNLRTFSH